jgi:uncharacterized membrane protein
MDPYLRDVLDACIRVLHVVAGIAWIGASFYFVRLDLALRRPRRPEDEEAGVAGEFWGVHGGGLYHSQKYRLAPAEMPEPLHWFKWEAYTTWLSGFALLVLLYYLDGDIRLIDPAVADLATWQAVGLSLLGIVLAWVVYDVLCRVLEERSEAALVVTGTALVALAAWGAGQLFAARAAYLQVGVMLGTVMVANVFFVIIPAHRKLVAAMEDGREPDPVPLRRAKARSVHNNYLTLPVLFTMLAGHFAFTYGASEAWLVLLAVIVLTALLRVFFNRWHAGRQVWWIPAVTTVGVVALAFWLRPDDTTPATPGEISFAEVESVIAQRCATCHSGTTAPLGVRLETQDEIEARIHDIERMAVQTEAMPPGNVTGMTEEERTLLASWVAQNG